MVNLVIFDIVRLLPTHNCNLTHIPVAYEERPQKVKLA